MKPGNRDSDGEWIENGVSPEESPDEGDETNRPSGPLSHFPSARYARPAVIVCGVCLVFTLLYGSDNHRDLLWVSGGALYHRLEWWRPFTALATHAGLAHLLSNSLLVIVFGWMLHAYYGMVLFPIASLAAGIITNCITAWFYDPSVRLLGASGMAYGMVAMWLVCYLSHDSDRRLPLRVMRATGFAAVMLIPAAIEPGVSYLSHAVGFFVGILMGLPLARMRGPRVPEGPSWNRGPEKSS